MPKLGTLLRKHPFRTSIVCSVLALLIFATIFAVVIKTGYGMNMDTAPSPYVLYRGVDGRPMVGSGLPHERSTMLKFLGMTLWAMPNGNDEEHAQIATLLWANLSETVDQLKSWGVNCIRLRVDALQFNSMTQADQYEYINKLQSAIGLITGKGMYVNVSFWDDTQMKQNWLNDYPQLFPLIEASLRTVGSNPLVFYNPVGEPNQLTPNGNNTSESDAWVKVVTHIVQHYRQLGYFGLLVIGTWNNSYGYSSPQMQQVEQFDANLAGMHGQMQVGFDQHDYAVTPPHRGMDGWLERVGGRNQTHLLFEFEFGNQNADRSTVDQSWSQAAAQAFGVNGQIYALPWFGGGAAFNYLWPFQLPDGNSIVDRSGNLTTWGLTVYHYYLGREGTPVTMTIK